MHGPPSRWATDRHPSPRHGVVDPTGPAGPRPPRALRRQGVGRGRVNGHRDGVAVRLPVRQRAGGLGQGRHARGRHVGRRPRRTVMTERPVLQGRRPRTDRERFRSASTAKKPTDITLVPAITPPAPPPQVPATTAAQAPAPIVAPLGSPSRCGGDTFRVAFEDDKAYLTSPDDTVVVLKEVKVADAPASRRTYSNGRLRSWRTRASRSRGSSSRARVFGRPCSSTR